MTRAPEQQPAAIAGRPSFAAAAFATAALLAVFVSFAPIGSRSLWLPDEPRVAGIGREMLDRADLAVPVLGDEPFLEKPPLYWWAQIASYECFGLTDAASRAPSAFFGVLALLAVFFLGKHAGGARVGLASVGVLATLRSFAGVSHKVVVDSSLVFGVALAYLGFLLWHLPRTPRQRRLGAVWLVIAITVSFLAKGAIGPMLAVGPPAVYLLVTRQFKALFSAWPVAIAAAGVFLAVVGAWLFAVERSAGMEAVRTFVVDENLGRFLGTRPGDTHVQPPWYYLPKLPAELMLWTLAVPALLSARLRARREMRSEMQETGGGGRRDDAVRALLFVFGFGVLLLSASAGKRAVYLAPLLPAIAVPIGWWLVRAASAGSRLDRRTLFAIQGAIAILPILLFAAAGLRRLGLFHLTSRTETFLASDGALLAGAVLVPLGIALFLDLRKRVRTGRTAVPEALVVSICMLGIAYEFAESAALDPTETLHPMTAAVAREMPGDGPVPAYRAREGLVGILYFDLGRRVRDLTLEEAAQWLSASPDHRLVFEEKRGKELRETYGAHLRDVFRGPLGSDSTHAIVAWDGP